MKIYQSIQSCFMWALFMVVFMVFVMAPISGTVYGATKTVSTDAELRAAINSASAGDTIEITADITLSTSVIAIDKEITIQTRNEKKITQSNSGVRHFRINSGGKVTLQDIVLDGSDTGGGINIYSNGECIMNDGALIRNCYADYGGAVDAKGTLIVRNGEISNNKSKQGGGVYISNTGGAMTMYDGKIFKNNSESIGGGATVASGGTFTMYGGEISDNSSAQGGGVSMFNAGALFTMKGGTISHNVAQGASDREALGGGLYLNSGATAEIYAGRITDNSVTAPNRAYGGGIYTTSDTNLIIYNAVVTENEASNQGGGFWVCPTGNAMIGDFRGTAIYDNKINTVKQGKDIHLEARTGTSVMLTDLLLGGGAVKWLNEDTGAYQAALSSLQNKLNLSAEINQSDESLAKKFATVSITNNASVHNGGGLAINGNISFGEESPEKIDLVVKKAWDDNNSQDRPTSIKVYLVINCEKQENTYVTLNEGNSWKSTFEDLDYDDAKGNVIMYSVLEDVPAGYKAEYGERTINFDGNYEIEITNKNEPDTGSLEVEKQVTGNGKPEASAQFTFTLKKGSATVNNFSYQIDGGATQTATDGTFKLKDGEKAVISGLDLGSDYTVVEATPAAIADVDISTSSKVGSGSDKAGLTSDAISVAKTTGGSVVFTNHYVKDTGSLEVEKQVTGDGKPEASAQFTFTLKKGNATVNNFSYQVDGGATQTATDGTFKLKGGEKAVISGLDLGSDYTVVEAAPAAIADVDISTSSKVGSESDKAGLTSDAISVTKATGGSVVFTNHYVKDTEVMDTSSNETLQEDPSSSSTAEPTTETPTATSAIDTTSETPQDGPSSSSTEPMTKTTTTTSDIATTLGSTRNDPASITTNANDHAVGTGDDTNLTLYEVLAVLTGLAAVGAILPTLKRHRKNK